MANNIKYVIDDGKNKFAAYDAETVDSLLNEKVNNDAFNSAVEELEGEIEQKANTEYVNEEIARIETIIEDLPEPMIFKGTLGTGGTIQDLPTASASNEGFTYKVITAGTYAGQSARVGDVFISNGSEWVLVPAGDDFNDTWRAIKVNGTEVLNNAISSGAVNFNEGDQLTITFDAETKTLNFNVVNTYTKQEVDDIIYNVLPDGTASGAIANFNTSLQLPIKSMQIDVNAKQDLHGYEYPWAAGGGKNKCSMGNETFIQFQEVEISEIPAGDYVFSSIITSTDTDGNQCAIVFLDENKNTLVTRTIERSVGNNRVSTSFSVSTPIKFIRSYAGSGYPAGAGDTASFVDNMICLQSESNPITFEPYENICPIEGVENINILHNGKNLIEIDNLTNRPFWGTNEPNIVNAINKLPNGIYTISNKFKINELPENNKVIHGCVYLTALVNGTQQPVTTYRNTVDNSPSIEKIYQESATFEITDLNKGKINQAYLYCDRDATHTGTGRGLYDFYDVQVEIGNIMTEFAAFNGVQELINLNGTYYGGKFTQDKDGHRHFEVTHGIKLLGDISFNRSNNGGAWQNYLFYAQITDKTNGGVLKCSNYEYVVQATSTMQNEKIISVDSSKYIYVRDDAYTTVADFKTANANTQLVYPLATPIIIDLPDGEPINTFSGINNFFADSGDTTVTFKQSVNDAINAALNAANSNRMLSMFNMSKGNESEEKEETKEDLTEESNEK